MAGTFALYRRCDSWVFQICTEASANICTRVVRGVSFPKSSDSKRIEHADFWRRDSLTSRSANRRWAAGRCRARRFAAQRIAEDAAPIDLDRLSEIAGLADVSRAQNAN